MLAGDAPGLGIDLVEIGRVERALARRPGLAERLFTESELAFASERSRPGPHLAARFAAKEAALKALGGGVELREIEVVGGGREAPALVLHGAAADRAHALGLDLRVSLTHTAELAGAAVASR